METDKARTEVDWKARTDEIKAQLMVAQTPAKAMYICLTAIMDMQFFILDSLKNFAESNQGLTEAMIAMIAMIEHERDKTPEVPA